MVKRRNKTKGGAKAVSLKSQLQLQSMVIPAIIFVIIFAYIPMYGNIIAFQDYNIVKGSMGSTWVGLKYFRQFFTDPNFFNVLKNTLGINIIGLIITFPAPIIFALLLNELQGTKFKKLIQTVSYLPHFVSWAVFGGFVLTILSPSNGIINLIGMRLGILEDPVNFIGQAKNFWTIMITASLVKGLGWGSIIYIAAISGVSPELYESAVIDGANRFQKMWYITVPSIAATISIMLIFAISGVLNSGYEKYIILQNSLNLDTSEVIDTYVFKIGLQQMRYSYATAVGVAKSIVAVILLVGANWASKKISDNSLF